MKNPRWLRLVAVSILGVGLLWVYAAAAPDASGVQFNTDNIGPRQIEDVTARNIPRDYGRAWETLATALEQNRTDLVGQYFVGFAQDKLAKTIAEQKKSGLRTRYIDHGHKVAAYFYSPDGGVMELHDTAQLEIQILDGTSVVHSDNATVHYVALMTPAADRWNVRLLEAVPNF